jgi:hypothetical protein
MRTLVFSNHTQFEEKKERKREKEREIEREKERDREIEKEKRIFICFRVVLSSLVYPEVLVWLCRVHFRT